MVETVFEISKTEVTTCFGNIWSFPEEAFGNGVAEVSVSPLPDGFETNVYVAEGNVQSSVRKELILTVLLTPDFFGREFIRASKRVDYDVGYGLEKIEVGEILPKGVVVEPDVTDYAVVNGQDIIVVASKAPTVVRVDLIRKGQTDKAYRVELPLAEDGYFPRFDTEDFILHKFQ